MNKIFNVHYSSIIWTYIVSNMAEAHAAVAFSFAVTPEGVDVQVSFKF